MAKRHYTEVEIERGIQALARFNGPNAASKALKEAGHPIPASTLKDWRHRYEDRYEQTRQRVLDRAYADIADEWKDFFRRSIDEGKELVAKVTQAREADDSQEAKRWSDTVRNMGVVGGISTQRSAEADQRPVEIQPARDTQAIEAELKRLGVLVEAEAVEVEPETLGLAGSALIEKLSSDAPEG